MSKKRLTSDDLAAIERRLAAASPGPWRAEQDQVFTTDDVLADICCGEINQAISDAVFIAAARDDIERLIHEIHALRAELASAA